MLVAISVDGEAGTVGNRRGRRLQHAGARAVPMRSPGEEAGVPSASGTRPAPPSHVKAAIDVEHLSGDVPGL